MLHLNNRHFRASHKKRKEQFMDAYMTWKRHPTNRRIAQRLQYLDNVCQQYELMEAGYQKFAFRQLNPKNMFSKGWKDDIKIDDLGFTIGFDWGKTKKKGWPFFAIHIGGRWAKRLHERMQRKD